MFGDEDMLAEEEKRELAEKFAGKLTEVLQELPPDPNPVDVLQMCVERAGYETDPVSFQRGRERLANGVRLIYDHTRNQIVIVDNDLGTADNRKQEDQFVKPNEAP